MQAAHFWVAVANMRHIVAAVQVVSPLSVKQMTALATHNVQGGIIGQGCVGADQHAALGYNGICLQYGLLQEMIAGSGGICSTASCRDRAGGAGLAVPNLNGK